MSYGNAKGFLSVHMNVYKNDCIIWPHSLSSSGYPQITIDRVKRNVHVIVCERHYGERPSPTHEAAHSCGNRACINWRHLRWATGAENQADRLAHGTDGRGERNPQAKLTEANVREIRRLSVGAERWTRRGLSGRFGVSTATISGIVNRRNWGWLE